MRLLLTLGLCFFMSVLLLQLTEPASFLRAPLDNAERFRVVGVKDDQYRVLRLAQVLNDPAGYRFRLDEQNPEFRLGANAVNILDSTPQKQVIVVQHVDEPLSTSIYEVADNQVTPLNFRVKSEGSFHGVFAFLLLMPAYAVASLFTRGRRRRR